MHELFKSSDEKIDPNVLWEIIFKSFEMKSLLGASINVQGGNQEGRLFNGLVMGHAYSILDAFELISNNGQFNELRKSYADNQESKDIKLLL